MPRRAAAVRRETQPDAKYNNRLVTQLINKVLLDGKKSTAEGIVYDAFDIVAEKTEPGRPDRIQEGNGQHPPHARG